MTVVGLHHVQIACPRGSEDSLRASYGGRFHTEDPVGNRLEIQQA